MKSRIDVCYANAIDLHENMFQYHWVNIVYIQYTVMYCTDYHREACTHTPRHTPEEHKACNSDFKWGLIDTFYSLLFPYSTCRWHFVPTVWQLCFPVLSLNHDIAEGGDKKEILLNLEVGGRRLGYRSSIRYLLAEKL